MESDTYTVRETAKILKVAEPQVRKLINRGELPSVKNGTQHAIPQDAVHERLRLIRLAGQTPESMELVNQELAIDLGRERARREITQHAQSSLEERIKTLEAKLEDANERRADAEAEVRQYQTTINEQRESGTQTRRDLDTERERRAKVEAELEFSRRSVWKRIFGG